MYHLTSTCLQFRWLCLCGSVLLLLSGGAISLAHAQEVTVRDVRRVNIIANSIVYDAHSQKIYASVPARAGRGGNSVVPIDPNSGDVGAPIPVGSDPNAMVVTDDGKYLYAVLQGINEIRRVDLPMLKADAQFPVQGGLRSMASVPGNHDMLVVSRGATGMTGSGIAVMEKGVLKPDVGAPNGFAVTFPNRVHTYQNEISSWDFMTYAIGANGLQLRGATVSLLSGYIGIFGDGNGRVFTTNGQVIDPEQRRILGSLARPADVPPMVDPSVGRIFFLNGNHIHTADYSTFVNLDTLVVPDAGNEVRNLIRWGEDGLAFLNEKQIVVIRAKGLWKPITPTDLVVSMQRKPDKVTVGQSYTLTVTATNNGKGEASGVVLTLSLPEDLKLVSSTLSKDGQITPVNGVVAAQIGSIKPKEKVTLTVVATPVGAKKFMCSVVVRANEPDAHPENNVLDYELDNTDDPGQDKRIIRHDTKPRQRVVRR